MLNAECRTQDGGEDPLRFWLLEYPCDHFGRFPLNPYTRLSVTVNERPPFRQGAFFYGGDSADNTASSVFKELEVYAAINPPGTNTPDTVYAETNRVFVAKTPELFAYDADGNMTSDGRFHYFWNGENRLVCASNADVVVTYAYDLRGRMVRKAISHRGTEARRIEYLWDDWNIIREIQWPVTSDQWSVGTLATGHGPLVTDYVWGLDLDGTLQGAGGVGGLLAVVRADGVFLPTYDANGNVSEYVTTNGEIVAHYDYSPFGEPLVASGELASTFTHQFSTKPYCPVTGFSEYQMRKYRPGIGRWMSKDPIGEVWFDYNLEGFIDNSPIDLFDVLGLYEPGQGEGADGRPQKEGRPCNVGNAIGRWTCKLVTINGSDASAQLTGGKKEYDMHQKYKKAMKKWKKAYKKWEKTRQGPPPIPPYPEKRDAIDNHDLFNPTLCFLNKPQCQDGWNEEGRAMFWHASDGDKTPPQGLTYPDHDCPGSSRICFEIESRYMTTINLITLELEYKEPDVSKFNLSTWCCKRRTTPLCLLK